MPTRIRDRPHYRPDIDGLRAISIAAVVLFHGFPNRVPGGFVGVDVFFVISGFLIGRNLFDEIDRSGSFNPLAFYRRRALRILPALLSVLFCTIVAAMLFLRQDDLTEVKREAISGATFVSNFFWWNRLSSYFSSSANLSSLLHLWSLSVEEQFYLAFPLLGLLLARFGERAWLVVLATATTASLLICLSLTDEADRFFGPHARFWELGCGVLLAALVRRQARGLACLRRLPGWVGLLLIVFSCLFFQGHSTTPVMAIAIPVLGSSLFIWSESADASRSVLSHPGSVFIGRISYPLYLWHWPILCFARHLATRSLTSWMTLSLIGGAVALAALTYLFIESPIRDGRRGNREAAALVAAMVVVGGFASAAPDLRRSARSRSVQLADNDKPPDQWFPPDDRCIREVGLSGLVLNLESTFCSMSAEPAKVGLVILGDSTANSLYPGFASVLGRRGIAVANIGEGTCAPALGITGHYAWNRNCDEINQRAYSFVLSHPNIHTVLLGFTPYDFLNMDYPGAARMGDEYSLFQEEAARLLRGVQQLQTAGKSVILSFDVPYLEEGYRECLNLWLDTTDKTAFSCTRSLHPTAMRYLDWWRKAVAANGSICVFRQTPPLLATNGEVLIVDGNGFLFRDAQHLTRRGSDAVAAGFVRSACFARTLPPDQSAR